MPGGCGRDSRLKYLLLEPEFWGEKVSVLGRGKRRELGRETRAGKLDVDAVGLGS